MIIFYDKDNSYKRDKYDSKEFGDIDTSIVVTHMMLEAESLGLKTTWIGSFNPKNFIPVAILPIGYALEGTKPSKLHFQRKTYLILFTGINFKQK